VASNNKLIDPVLIVGSTRSGTSMLVQKIGLAPGMTQLYEPNALWMTGHAYRGHEAATELDIRPWVSRRIRKYMLKFQKNHEGKRIAEKSPANSLRIRYIHSVFPNSPIVFIYRDGRDFLRSQEEKYQTFKAGTLLLKSTRRNAFNRLKELPWWEWPSFAPRYINNIFRSYISHKPIKWFGIRYPDWKKDLNELDQTQLIAKQWVVAVETALADLEHISSNKYIKIRYEDIVSDPRKWFKKIGDFCDINMPDEYLDEIENTVHTKSIGRYRVELSEDSLQKALQIMEPCLERLGYLSEKE